MVLGEGLINQAILLRDLGRPSDAAAVGRRAVAILQGLVAGDRKQVDYSRVLGGADVPGDGSPGVQGRAARRGPESVSPRREDLPFGLGIVSLGPSSGRNLRFGPDDGSLRLARNRRFPRRLQFELDGGGDLPGLRRHVPDSLAIGKSLSRALLNLADNRWENGQFVRARIASDEAIRLVETLWSDNPGNFSLAHEFVHAYRRHDNRWKSYFVPSRFSSSLTRAARIYWYLWHVNPENVSIALECAETISSLGYHAEAKQVLDDILARAPKTSRRNNSFGGSTRSGRFPCFPSG